MIPRVVHSMEGTEMIHRIIRVPGVGLLAAAVTLLSLTACGGEASKYSGSWKQIGRAHV